MTENWTTAQLQELIAGTEGVTPGPWTVNGRGAWICTVGNNRGDPAIFGPRPADGEAFRYGDKKSDARHIAACSPERIRSLCEALLAARAALAEVSREIGSWTMFDKNERETTVAEFIVSTLADKNTHQEK
jgi:hypothetical protein